MGGWRGTREDTLTSAQLVGSRGGQLQRLPAGDILLLCSEYGQLKIDEGGRIAGTLVDARHGWECGGAPEKEQVLLVLGGCSPGFRDVCSLPEATGTKDGETAVEEGATELGGFPRWRVLHE